MRFCAISAWLPSRMSVPWSAVVRISTRLGCAALVVERLRRRGRVPVAVPGQEQLRRTSRSAGHRGPAVSPSMASGAERVTTASISDAALRGVDERGGAAHARPDQPDPPHALGAKEPDRAADVLPDRGDVLVALGAARVTARAVPAEVERQRPVAEGAQLVGEVEPRASDPPAACARARRPRSPLRARTSARRAARRRSTRTTPAGSRRAPARGSPRPDGRREARHDRGGNDRADQQTEPRASRLAHGSGTSGAATCPASSAGGASASEASCASSSASSCGAS